VTSCRPQSCLDRDRTLDQVLGRGGVVELRARVRVRQDAGVVDTADDDAHAALGCQREQIRLPRLVDERVPAGEQDRVDVGLTHEPRRDGRLVHPETDRTDDALVAQVVQNRVGLADGLVGEVVRVVDVDDIDPVQPEPVEGVADRAAHTLGAEVEDRLRLLRVVELAGVRGPLHSDDESSDLRRENERAAVA